MLGGQKKNMSMKKKPLISVYSSDKKKILSSYIIVLYSVLETVSQTQPKTKHTGAAVINDHSTERLRTAGCQPTNPQTTNCSKFQFYNVSIYSEV